MRIHTEFNVINNNSLYVNAKKIIAEFSANKKATSITVIEYNMMTTCIKTDGTERRARKY